MSKKNEKAKELAVEPTSDGRSRFQQLLAGEMISKIQKKYGSTMLIRASDDKHQELPRIPSGIFPLDYALGGGWPAGRINTIYGPKSSSKTTTLLKTIAQAQRMCGSCFTEVVTPDGEVKECKCKSYREMVCSFIDVEGTYDKAWAKVNGINEDRLFYSKPDFAEQALDISEALIRSGDVDVLILDSLAFLTPFKEIEESVEKETMGVQARLIGKGVRKLNAALNAIKNEFGRHPTIFFTNQIRMKLGVMFGNPETTPGGLAPGFVSTTEVKVWPGKYLMDETGTGKPFHVDMNFRVEKNKSGPAKMEGHYRILLMDTDVKKIGEVYDEDQIVNMAQKCSLVEGGGPSWRCLGEQFGSKSLIEKRLTQDPVFKSRLREAVMTVLLAA